MSKDKKTYEILSIMHEMFPNAKCELCYNNLYELTIAVMLSAQTTDKKVNIVTKELFKKYPDIYSLNNASIDDLENIIKPLGLYHNKAKNLKSLAFDVVTKYNGVIPSTHDELTKLSGVGNKSANVVLVEYFNIPSFPVDTHIERVAKRLGFVKQNQNVKDVEEILKELILPSDYHMAHHLFLFFGRYHCLKRGPKCSECPLKKYCVYE